MVTVKLKLSKELEQHLTIVIDLDDLWAKERIKDTRYIETNKGIHRYLLINN